MQKLSIFLSVAILFCASCSSHKPATIQQEQQQVNTVTETQDKPNVESGETAQAPQTFDIPESLCFYIAPRESSVDIGYNNGNHKYPLSRDFHINLLSSTKVAFSLPSSYDLSIIERIAEDKIENKGVHRASKDSMIKKLSINLNDFQHDTDWFIFSDNNKLSSRELESIVQRISTPSLQLAMGNAKRTRSLNAPANFTIGTKVFSIWRLFLVRPDSRTAQQIASMKIFRSPVVVTPMVKKKGEREFSDFSFESEAIRAGDELKLSIAAYKKCYAAIFLCGTDNTVEQLYPSLQNDSMQPLEKNTLFFVPSQDAFSFDNTVGTELLCTFYSNKELNCDELYRWLAKNKLNGLLSQNKRGYATIDEVPELVAEENPPQNSPSAKADIPAPRQNSNQTSPVPLYVFPLNHQAVK